MLRKLLGYLLAGIGFVGFGYFRYYEGSVINYTWLWFCISIIIGLIGLTLIGTGKSYKISSQEEIEKKRLKKLKQNGEKILLTAENCEIKSNCYYEEDLNDNMSRSQMIDASFVPNRNYSQSYIEQSVIIYYYTLNEKKFRMTSQSFPFNKDTITNFIQNRLVCLYVSHFDKNEYAFELIV